MEPLDSPLEDGKIKRAKTSGKPVYLTQIKVNGNYYILFFGPPNDDLNATKNNVFVQVWAKLDGSKGEIPDRPHNLGSAYHDSKYKRLASAKKRMYKFNASQKTFDELVSEVLNKAICKLENKQEKEQQFADDVLAAIQANKKVHSGIDYELESN
jgi:hypothetical protein